MHVRDVERLIPDLTGILVIVITVSSFVLSFCNLQATAIQSGINPWLSWMFPICVDCLLIAGSMMILRENLRGGDTRIGWGVLVAFTGVSIVFNVSQSPSDAISIAVHLVTPVSLCVSVELLMIILKGDIAGKQVSLAGSDATPDENDATRRDTDATVSDVMVATVATPCDTGQIMGYVVCDTGSVDIEKHKRVNKDEIAKYIEENPNCTNTEAAIALGYSRTTISKYRKQNGRTTESNDE